jgi:hypothetical protein
LSFGAAQQLAEGNSNGRVDATVRPEHALVGQRAVVVLDDDWSFV